MTEEHPLSEKPENSKTPQKPEQPTSAKVLKSLLEFVLTFVALAFVGWLCFYLANRIMGPKAQTSTVNDSTNVQNAVLQDSTKENNANSKTQSDTIANTYKFNCDTTLKEN